MSAVNIWDYCKLDPGYVDELEKWQESWNGEKKHKQQDKTAPSSSASTHVPPDTDHYQQLEQALIDAESSCRTSLELLDNVLVTTEKVQTDFEDVTGRTNSLMAKCEALLDQQHALQHTVEVLEQTLKPFNEIEEVASVLGIPMPLHPSNPTHTNTHTPTHTHAHIPTPDSSITSSNIDVRSPEFIEILSKLSHATAFLKKNRDIHDADMYVYVYVYIGCIHGLIYNVAYLYTYLRIFSIRLYVWCEPSKPF
ncbi:hypothetical protein EON64_07265 [archaeon]|nr:MAG: hypothetical protein EON64_07265 [archaeon]